MAVITKDAKIPEDCPKDLLLEKHAEFIGGYGKDENDYEFVMAEFLRLNGVYWGLTAAELMRKPATLDKEKLFEFVLKCFHESEGGFSPMPEHDPHILYTLSAVQIAVILDREDDLDKDKIADYVVGLQQGDGSFSGDRFGEIDTRFSFCAAAALSLLGKLDAMDVAKASAFKVLKKVFKYSGRRLM